MPCLVGNATPSSKVKSNYNGIVVAKSVTWNGWQPGYEYKKDIVLKNINVKTQKLKYRVPSSRFFTTIYPKTIVLSAGTSFSLPVTFHPLEKNIYEDKIEFVTQDGEFSVPIRAVLPVHQICVPQHINFHMCAVHDTVQLSFSIENTSELVTPYKIDCLAPFEIDVDEGRLEPHSACERIISFKPTDALVYEAVAVVTYGAKFDKAESTKLEGIGKYPHIMLNCGGGVKDLLNFGEVPVSKTAELWVALQNLSPVNTPFTIEHPMEESIDSAFTCSLKQGIVPAFNMCRIPFTYYPRAVGMESIDYFHVKTVGNISNTSLKCVGKSTGPQVHISQTMINFHQIDIGSTATRVIDIVNNSNCEATYQFMLDCTESVYIFEKTCGTLPPKSKATLRVQFTPAHPINYYRRVTCLVHNESPLFIDLIGTCHSETQKPAVLKAEHIKRYNTHVQRALSYTSPEQLNEMVKSGELMQDENGHLMKKPTDTDATASPPSVEIGPYGISDYFNDGYYSDIVPHTPHVSVDVHEIDFSRCVDPRIIPQQTVNVTNHTKGKVTMAWSGDENHAFSVSPMMADIPPLKSYSFRVTFKPNAPDQFYGAELEGYAYYKSMRDYRLVEDLTHCPPWCVTVVAVGHTFGEQSETFLPNYQLDTPKIIFPAVNSHERGYQSCLLTNTGTNPIVYHFDCKQSSTFSVKPTRGIVWPKCDQVFIIQALPTDVKCYKEILDLKMNEDAKNTQEISVLCSAEVARVRLDNGGELYFKPTCIGASSCRTYSVSNTSRLALEYEWKFHHPDDTLLDVQPQCGIIQPNEHQEHKWYFHPKKCQKFVMKPCLIVGGKGLKESSSAGKKQQFTVRVIGEGCQGKIQSDREYVDFGTVVVGNVGYSHVVLTNDSACSIHYQLHLTQTISSPYDDRPGQEQPIAIELEQTQGEIEAHSRVMILATFTPKSRVSYQCTLTYDLVTTDGIPTTPSPVHLCHILGAGVYPTLSITDARCYGSAFNISKKQLWNLFSLDDLNVCFDSDPSPAELRYTMATRQGHHRKPEVFTRAILDFNFSAAPVGSEACVVQLMLENTGTVTADWAFMFPPDLQLELEYWAESGDFTDEELHHMKVMDNKLFQVSPKSGRLKAGEQVDVTFVYHHDIAGTDRLPVLLKLAQGREILLNFIGVTVDPSRKYVHFPSNKFQFAPVPIGEKISPTQVYELYNGGALPVKYEIDVRPLEQLRMANYEHAVFECLQPIGEIQPGQTTAVQWRFSPLEASTYSVDVPIHIHGGDIAVVTMSGVGYDSRALGATMPITDGSNTAGIPARQTIEVAGQLFYLSEERLSLGNIPQFSRARRMVVFTNRSMEHDVSFVWHVTSKANRKLITISPHKGELKTGESCMCRVTFLALGDPSFYDLDLVCEVTNMTDYRKYCKKLERWEAERLRQQVEFTITEDTRDDPEEAQMFETSGRPRSGQLQSLSGGATPNRESDTHLAKYKTLPPIQQPTMEIKRYMEKAQRNFESQYWEKPSAPQPFLLHLGVTARTHDVWEYQQLFDDQYNNYVIDRSLGSQDTAVTASIDTDDWMLSEGDKLVCVETEHHVVAAALSNVIRGLLDDAQFHDCIQSLDDERIPYFQQYSTRPPAVPPIIPSPHHPGGRSPAHTDPGDGEGAGVLPDQTATGRLPQDEEHNMDDLLSEREEPLDLPAQHQDEAVVSRAQSIDSAQVPGSASQLQHSDDNLSIKPPTPYTTTTPPPPPPPAVVGPVSSKVRPVGPIHPPGGAGSPVSGVEAPDRAPSGSRRASDGSRPDTQSSGGAIPAAAPGDGAVSPAQILAPLTAAQIEQLEMQRKEQQIKKSAEFTTLVEGVLENTLMNIVEEAFNEDFNITARPRLVALLPRPKSADRAYSPPVSR